MSDVRIFCIGGFIGCGLMATAGNHGFMDRSVGSVSSQLVFAILLGGCLAVSFFGRRAR